MACLVGIAAGIVVFKEGKKVKKVEGIPVEEEEVENDAEKAQESLGVTTAGPSEGNEKGQATNVAEERNGKAVVPADGNEMEDGDAKSPLTRKSTRTEKTRGKDWYERN